MQQQTPPQQEQCGVQQLPQPVMLCPVQYVYETPMVLPQPQGHQTQQNQILLNVKNPPPWIQNRPQNQVVYVQQIQNSYQPYLHPQMIQNPMYQPQMTYQIQPMLAQDNRQFIQIPNMSNIHQNYNVVQNPSTQTTNEESDKMPLLTQMLNQKANNNNRVPNVNNVNVINVRPNMPTAVNLLRPVTQNQQVQTDNVSPNIKGRPRNVPPQIITINPMQHRQLINQKQESTTNIRPMIRNDVPQHIRTKIPSSISVKTLTRPIHPRSHIRPFDVMTAPQNFYYNPVIMTVPQPEAKNVMTNPEYLKPSNVQGANARMTMPIQYQVPISNVPPYMNVTRPTNSVDNSSPTQFTNANVSSKQLANPNNIKEENDKIPILDKNTVKNAEIETQTEERLIRNTVFVQARGRVLNDKEIVQTHSIKRTIDDRLKEESQQKQEETISEANNSEEDTQKSKKIKVEPTAIITDNNNINHTTTTKANELAPGKNIQSQQSKINNLQISMDNKHNAISKTNNFQTIVETKNSSLSNPPEISKNNSEDNIKLKSEEIKLSHAPNKPTKIMKMKENKYLKNKKAAVNNVSDKAANNQLVKEETDIEDAKKKDSKITVLTHVLEGYIIQESNVAFPVQKPITEKEIKKEEVTSKHPEPAIATLKKEESEGSHEGKSHFSWKHLNKSIESEKEMEFSVVEKDGPFANIVKSMVESWTADQLASHLKKHKWAETAAKLLDEEIDGESLVLVNKDQLVAIGVNEEHAEVIATFAAS